MGFSTIDDGFWTDPAVLKLSPEAKLVFFWLISNPTRHYTGLYVLHLEILIKQTQASPKKIGHILRKMEEAGFIMIDGALDVVWVKNMFKYQTGRASKLSPQQHGGLKKHLSDHQLHSTFLIREFCNKYKYLGVVLPEGYTPIDTPIDTPPIGVGYRGYGIGIGSEELIQADKPDLEEHLNRDIQGTNIYIENNPQEAAAGQKITPRDLIALYNDIDPHERKKDVLVTDKRLDKARVRLLSFPTREFWGAVFHNVKNSPFLRCANGNRWNGGRGADLDWLLLNDSNPAKVWEGKYDDKTSGPGGEPPDPFASRTDTLKN